MRRIERKSANASTLPILVIFGLVFFCLYAFFDNPDRFPHTFLLSLLFFIFAFFSATIFLSFFILPIKGTEGFIELLKRIFLFALRLHGPILFVRNGNPEVIHAGYKANNPGLIYLDSASAAIISRTTSYHRVVGPGISFTQKDEYILSAINLAPQKKWLGPYEDEDPFSPRLKNERIEEFQSRQKRAEETCAYTADGRKIIASFLLEFKLDAETGEGESPFGYNPIAVKKAVLGQPVIKSEEKMDSAGDWSNLPGFLIISYWKQYIGHHRLGEIFSTKSTKLAGFAEEIRGCIIGNNLQEVKSPSQLEAIRQMKNQKGIALLNFHLIHVYLEDATPLAMGNDYSRDFPLADDQINNKKQDVITNNTIQSRQILGNILAGIINSLVDKRSLTYEDLSKTINQNIRPLLKK
jgi:hypothetical protein